MRFILARHGQSAANVDPEAWRGRGESPPLTALGEEQADRLGGWLRENRTDIDAIVASPLVRAVQTAEIANKHLNLPMETWPELEEISRGDLPILRVRKHPLISADERDADDAEGAAYYQIYRAQVSGGLDKLLADLERPNTLLVISHGGTMGTLLRLILDRHDILFRTWNTGMHYLEWREGRWRIDGLNQTPHLPPEMIT
jgi:probable phosphoglycerate mutase